MLRTLSLILFAIVVTCTASVFGQDRVCTLKLKVIDFRKVETGDVTPITGAHVAARKIGTRKAITAVMLDGQPLFPKLTQGEYRLTITKPGFNRTLQEIDFACNNPGESALAYVMLKRGSSAQTFKSEKFTVTAGQLIIGTRESGNTAGPSGPGSVDANAVKSVTSTSRPVIRGDVLNGRALSLPKPEYPTAARSAGVSGTITVRVTIDEEGNVIFAAAVSGHPLLQSAAVEAARAAKFTPTLLSGQPVKVSGVINYNFALQ